MGLVFVIKRAGLEVLVFMFNSIEHTFIRLINVKMATLVAILTFISRMNTTSETGFKAVERLHQITGGNLAATTFGEKINVFLLQCRIR